MTNQILKCTFLVMATCVGIYAQTTGPLSTSYSSSGYPAATCANFSGNVCVLAQVCSQYNGSCTGANGINDPSVGGPGGLGNWQVYVSINGGSNVIFQTNSSAKSQGFIVLLGSAYDSWSLAPNQAGIPCAPTSLSNGYVGSFFKDAWNTGNRYYKVLMACQ